jgi:hypothetical protein
MPRDVRTHTRRTASGRTTTVRRHTRRGKPKRKLGPNPAHAGRLGRRARSAMRRNRKGKAAMLLTIALLEVVAWLTLNGTSFILALVAGLLTAISILLVK